MKRASKIAFAGAAIGIAATATPAQATTAPTGISECMSGSSCVSGTTTVNLGAFTNSPTVTGTVGIGGPLVTFTSTQGNLGTNTGAATVFIAGGDTLLTNLTFQILSGFTAAEFNLENGSPSSFEVKLTDSNGDMFDQTLSKLNGSNIFDIVAPVGVVYTSATLTGTVGGGFADFKQLRVIPGPGAVPEATTWAMMLVGFGGIAVVMRRRRRTALAQIA